MGQTEPEFPSSEIEIIKSFNARLAEAKMLSIQLPAHQVDTNRAFIRQYKLSDQPIKLNYPAPQVKPLAMARDENPATFPFYAKLGYGLQNNPFAELAYYASSDRFNLLAHASFESIKDIKNDNKKFQNIDAQLDIDFGISDMLQLNVGAKYLRQNRTVYGREYFDFENIAEFVYNIPEFSIGFQNALETELDIDYNLGYTYRNTSDNFDNKETNHAIQGAISKRFGDSGFYSGLSADLELNTLKNESEFQLNNYIFGLNLGLNKDAWNIAGGVDVAILADETKILPQALLNVMVSPLVRPYVGVQSRVKQNNFYNLSRSNPYITRILDKMINETATDIFGGVQGTFEQGKYEFRVGYEIADQKAFFINAFPDTSTYSIAHDDINSLSIGFNTDVELFDGLTAGVGLTFYSYSTDSLEEAWHLPTLSWEAFSRYDKLLNDKLAVTGKFNSESGIKYQTALNESETLGMYLNFSILLDYSISEKVEAFIHLNNLFDSQKDRFLGYDRIGINPQIGLKLRF